MKPINLLILPLLILLCVSPRAQSGAGTFSISGKIKGMRHGFVYIDYPRPDGQWHIDSCAVEKKKFHFSGAIKEPTLGVLRIGTRFCADDDPNAAGLYLETGTITITARRKHAKKMRVTGSATQIEKDSLDRVCAKIIKSGHDMAGRIMSAADGFIKSHPHSYESAFELSIYKTTWDVDTVISLYNQLDSSVQNSFYGAQVKTMRDAVADNSEGRAAKNFKATNTQGKTLQLADFKGKPVLLDFWASWCGPCREAIPHIKALYNQYHSQGLEIVSISCDDDTVAWRKAIEKDSTGIWAQVLSNYKNSQNPANSPPIEIKNMYAIYDIPVVFIIGRDGLIAGRFSGEDDDTSNAIDAKLKDVMQ